MIFQEKKNKNGYEYKTEDIFGTVTLVSTIKIEPEILDDIIVLLLKQNILAKTVKGTVRNGEEIISYEFIKRPIWEDEEENLCENTHTSISKPEKESIATPRFKIPAINWLKRFVVAFRKAWKNK